MIDPEGVRRKAENLYRDFLLAWLESEPFFPREIPCDKSFKTKDVVAAKREVECLRAGAKERLGYGFTVEWREANMRDFGRNLRPDKILFETQDDFLRLLRKHGEFTAFATAADAVRSEFPELRPWLRSNIVRFIDVAPQIHELLHVLRYFIAHPRPHLYLRELPIPVPTKFIEEHEDVLRAWLDRVFLERLPSAIIADENDFERRYGLRYSGPHILLRLLDNELQQELGFPCEEFSLPLPTLSELEVRNASVFIVENRINLLTLPRRRRTLAMGQMGHAVTLLRYVPWLADAPVTYWGDLDVEGFEILSKLRVYLPHVRSVFMDSDTLDRFSDQQYVGNATLREPPPHLHDAERSAFLRIRDANYRFEQEKIPHSEVLTLFNRIENFGGDFRLLR